MVQDVFGKHTDMFDEFKMILNARGATDSVQNDLWYSMPLSEIDFSQVRVTVIRACLEGGTEVMAIVLCDLAQFGSRMLTLHTQHTEHAVPEVHPLVPRAAQGLPQAALLRALPRGGGRAQRHMCVSAVVTHA